MSPRIQVSIHLPSDTRITFASKEHFHWLEIDHKTTIIFEDENAIHEMMGALEALTKLMLK